MNSITWKSKIGRSNCRRDAACSKLSSKHRSAIPTAAGAKKIRSRSRPDITTDTPPFNSPSRFPTGTRQSSNSNSPVWLPRYPILIIF